MKRRKKAGRKSIGLIPKRAKRIRKSGESWKNAMRRAAKKR